MTKILSKDTKDAFVTNMRWFANMGRITWKLLPSGKYAVHASNYAWSLFDLRGCE